MTNLFKFQVALTTVAGAALLLLGSVTGAPVGGLGFVVVFTSVVGWVTILALQGGNMVVPKEISGETASLKKVS